MQEFWKQQHLSHWQQTGSFENPFLDSLKPTLENIREIVPLVVYFPHAQCWKLSSLLINKTTRSFMLTTACFVEAGCVPVTPRESAHPAFLGSFQMRFLRFVDLYERKRTVLRTSVYRHLYVHDKSEIGLVFSCPSSATPQLPARESTVANDANTE